MTLPTQTLTLDAILRTIPKLTDGERTRVLQAIAACNSFRALPARVTITNDDANKDDNDELIVLRCICSALNEAQLEMRSPWQLKAMGSYASFRVKVPALMKYVAATSNRRIAREAVLNIGLNFLIADCRSMKLPIGANILMMHIHRVPACIDRHFPGYAQFGLLGHIVGEV